MQEASSLGNSILRIARPANATNHYATSCKVSEDCFHSCARPIDGRASSACEQRESSMQEGVDCRKGEGHQGLQSPRAVGAESLGHQQQPARQEKPRRSECHCSVQPQASQSNLAVLDEQVPIQDHQTHVFERNPFFDSSLGYASNLQWGIAPEAHCEIHRAYMLGGAVRLEGKFTHLLKRSVKDSLSAPLSPSQQPGRREQSVDDIKRTAGEIEQSTKN
jgi:hypothetical protein